MPLLVTAGCHPTSLFVNHLQRDPLGVLRPGARLPRRRGGRALPHARRRYSTVLKTTRRYARYALAALASVGFALSMN